LNKTILYDALKKTINAKKLFTRLWALPNILYELKDQAFQLHENLLNLAIDSTPSLYNTIITMIYQH